MKDVEISLNSTHIKPNEQILGNIKVNYTGRSISKHASGRVPVKFM